jgi:hypothetical protein
MAQTHNRKAALIAELELCRGEMRAATGGCATSLDVAGRVRSSVREHAWRWGLAAAAGGILLGFAFKLVRRRADAPAAPNVPGGAAHAGTPLRDAVRARAISALFGLVTDLARPALMEWLTSLLQSRTAAPENKRPDSSH